MLTFLIVVIMIVCIRYCSLIVFLFPGMLYDLVEIDNGGYFKGELLLY